MAGAVAAWHDVLTDPLTRAGWTRLARALNAPHEAYHQALPLLHASCATAGSLGVVTSQYRTYDGDLWLYLTNPLTGAASAEAGNFVLWAGPAVSTMIPHSSVALDSGVLRFHSVAAEGQVTYFRLIKDGVHRCGIGRFTALGAGPNEIDDPLFLNPARWFCQAGWSLNPPYAEYAYPGGGIARCHYLPDFPAEGWRRTSITVHDIAAPEWVKIWISPSYSAPMSYPGTYQLDRLPSFYPFTTHAVTFGQAGWFFRLSAPSIVNLEAAPQES